MATVDLAHRVVEVLHIGKQGDLLHAAAWVRKGRPVWTANRRLSCAATAQNRGSRNLLEESGPAGRLSLTRYCQPGQFCRGLLKCAPRSEEHTSGLQSRENLVCRLLLEK